jgi:Tfp pilus assembly protein PilZ
VAEKRKYRRLPVQPVPCRVHVDGQVVDLSIGGAFVVTERPLPPGTVVTFEVAVPGECTIRAQSLVEWTGDYFQGGAGSPCIGMGLSFREIDAEHRLAISRYLVALHTMSRRHRIATDLDARVRVGGRWTPGTVRELGERGLFMETEAVAPLGEEVDVLLRLPNASKPVGVSGTVHEVVGGDPNDNGTEAVMRPERGLEIEMTELSPRAIELVKQFLEEQRAEARAEQGET